MTNYTLGGVPIWKAVLNVLVPCLAVVILFQCARACVKSQIGRYAVTLMPEKSGGTRFVSALDEMARYEITDQQWSSLQLGESGHVVINGGESLLCATMALETLGEKMTPADVLGGLPMDAFEASGDIVWSRLVEHPMLAGKIELAHERAPDSELLDEAFDAHQAILLQVEKTKGERPYYVLLVGRTPKSYMVYDAHYGKINMLSRYRNAARWMVILRSTQDAQAGNGHRREY